MRPERTTNAAAAATALTAGAVLASALVSAGPSAAREHESFSRVATFPAYLNTDVSQVTVAEIATVTADGSTVIYTDSAGGGLGFVDIANPDDPRPAGYLSLGGDVEPTSVYATTEHLLVVVDTSASFLDPSGQLLVFDATAAAPYADWEPIKTIDLGGQPDSVDVTDDGRTVVVAIENQRDEEATPPSGEQGGLPQGPPGFLAVVDLHRAAPAWKARAIDLTGLAGIDSPEDPEPEYVSIAPDNRHVAVTLQENNAVVVVDLQTKKVRNHFSAGTVTVADVDTVEDGVIDPTGSITDVPREPDSVDWIGNDYLATANEGDWKGGSRGWTIFDAAAGAVVWDAGSSFEHLALSIGQYPEHRSENKGSEPEGLAVAEFDGVPYVFVGAERGNFVAVYDVSDPTSPSFVQVLSSTAGPEGLLPIPERDLLVVASEEDAAEDLVRATVQVYERGAGTPEFPGLVSAQDGAAPIGWGALSALSADPAEDGRLYAAWDSYYAESAVLAIDVTTSPARIVSTLPIVDGAGRPVGYDVEGLWAQPGGGFWLGVEGRTGAGNVLVEVDAAGVVQREVPLPAELQARIGGQGIEGVTGAGDGTDQVLYFVLQRALVGDPTSTARVGRYEVATGTFSWFGYPLETTTAPGDWVGLSEVTMVDEDTLAVVERDKLNGPDAVLKAIYSVHVPADLATTADPATLPIAQKTLARDVLPDLAALGGWVPEKLEGLTIGGNGNVYVVVDNDGIEDANGENVFLDLGPARDIFGAG